MSSDAFVSRFSRHSQARPAGRPEAKGSDWYTTASMRNCYLYETIDKKLARFILKKRIGDPHFVYSVDTTG